MLIRAAVLVTATTLLVGCASGVQSTDQAVDPGATEETSSPAALACASYAAENPDFTEVLDSVTVSGEALAAWYGTRTPIVVPRQVEEASQTREVTVCRLSAPYAAPPGPPGESEVDKGQQTALFILGLGEDVTLDVLAPDAVTSELFAKLESR